MQQLRKWAAADVSKPACLPITAEAYLLLGTQAAVADMLLIM
jgi:hypothetical protein